MHLVTGSTLNKLVLCDQKDAVCQNTAAKPPPILSELVWSSHSQWRGGVCYKGAISLSEYSRRQSTSNLK